MVLVMQTAEGKNPPEILARIPPSKIEHTCNCDSDMANCPYKSKKQLKQSTTKTELEI